MHRVVVCFSIFHLPFSLTALRWAASSCIKVWLGQRGWRGPSQATGEGRGLRGWDGSWRISWSHQVARTWQGLALYHRLNDTAVLDFSLKFPIGNSQISTSRFGIDRLVCLTPTSILIGSSDLSKVPFNPKRDRISHYRFIWNSIWIPWRSLKWGWTDHWSPRVNPFGGDASFVLGLFIST